MSKVILALDAGTTGIRALLFDVEGTIAGKAYRTLGLRVPAPGRIEQDAEELWGAAVDVIRDALARAGLTTRDIASIGIASQRSCVVVWDRKTVKPMTPIVSWQDTRGIERSSQLAAAGFLVMPQMAASKLESIVDTIPGGRDLAAAGTLAWGNVDTFLVAKLTAGCTHIADTSSACTTGYLDYFSGAWLIDLIAYQDLSPDFFPRLVDTYGTLAETNEDVFGDSVPIHALVADQQSAVHGHNFKHVGEVKTTFGTSYSTDAVTGGDLLFPTGAYPLVLSGKGSTRTYCVEGMVNTGGAFLDWVCGASGLARSLDEIESMSRLAASSGGVAVLPALQGLGAPYMDSSRRGGIFGLTQATERRHILHAVLEGAAFRVAEIVAAIFADASLPFPDVLKADGGGSVNGLFMQMVADRTGLRVECAENPEATSVGAAILADRSAGFFSKGAVDRLCRVERSYVPAWSADRRLSALSDWRRATGLPVR